MFLNNFLNFLIVLKSVTSSGHEVAGLSVPDAPPASTEIFLNFLIVLTLSRYSILPLLEAD